jgi:hypothetical protein
LISGVGIHPAERVDNAVKQFFIVIVIIGQMNPDHRDVFFSQIRDDKGGLSLSRLARDQKIRFMKLAVQKFIQPAASDRI